MAPNKRAKYYCKYNREWCKTFPYVSKISLGIGYFKCTYCKADVSITGGGKNDVTRHAKVEKHKVAERALKQSFKITDAFPSGDALVSKASSDFFVCCSSR